MSVEHTGGDRTALLGGVLFGAADPMAAAAHLAAWIVDRTPMPAEHRPDWQLCQTAAMILRDLPGAEVEAWCRCGAAWVLGYRASPPRPGWEPVISQPAALALPSGIARTTGETVIGLIGRAQYRIRIASPFIDREAIEALTVPLLAAADRGVRTSIVTQREDARGVLVGLVDAFTRAGRAAHIGIRQVVEPHPWPHLKVVAVDGVEGYIGSANLTGNALLGRNLELGVLLRGDLTPIENVLAVVAEAT